MSARQRVCASRCHPFSVSTQCALKPCPPLAPFLSSCSSFAPTPISSSIIHQHGLYVSLRIRESQGRILTLALFFLSLHPARHTAGKPRGLQAARKLRTSRRENRWADKSYKKRALGNIYRTNPTGGSSHAKGIVLEKVSRSEASVLCKRSEL